MSTNQKERKITQKQSDFARLCVELGNNCEAYRRSYKTDGWSEKAVGVEATRLAQHPRVSLEIARLRQEAAKRHEITIDTITEMLREDRQQAKDLGQASAAISAVTTLAKIHGLIVEKRQLSGDPDNPVQNISKIEVEIVDPASTSAAKAGTATAAGALQGCTRGTGRGKKPLLC